MKVVLSDSAFEDLENILSYYQQQEVPDVGIEFVDTIIKHIEVLIDHPDIGRIVPEFELPYIRELIHKAFRIVYLRETKIIKIIRVWRSERLLVLPTET